MKNECLKVGGLVFINLVIQLALFDLNDHNDLRITILLNITLLDYKDLSDSRNPTNQSSKHYSTANKNY